MNINIIVVIIWKIKILKISRYLFCMCRFLGKVNNVIGKIYVIVIVILIIFGDIIDKYFNG